MPQPWLAPIILAVGLSGCGAIGAVDFPTFGGGGGHRPPPAQPIVGAPTEPVQANELPPVGGQPDDNPYAAGYPADAQPGDDQQFGETPGPGDGAGGDLAAASPAPAPAGAREIGRTDLLGGWTIASGAENCQLFMTLTTWTGGYRASTRGCSSATLKGISAWKLDGRQVILAGEGGAPVARLYASGRDRFDGQTDGQVPISFYR